jgi:mRNA interferase RelE/StbE
MLQKSKFQGYKIEIDRSAQKDLNRLDQKIVAKVHETLKNLVTGDPRVRAEKLKAKGEQYKIRMGQYRIIFHEHKHVITILVVAVRTRENAYSDI